MFAHLPSLRRKSARLTRAGVALAERNLGDLNIWSLRGWAVASPVRLVAEMNPAMPALVAFAEKSLGG